jgi:hypothetical protein
VNLITLEHLRGACQPQRDIFAAVFPLGAPVTIRAAQHASDIGLEIDWLVRLIPEPLWDEYVRRDSPLRDEYLRQAGPICQLAPIWAAYERQLAQVLVSIFERIDRVNN